MEKKKDGPQSIDKKKSRDKRIVQYEQQLQEANRELTQSKMKSMFVIGITPVSLFGVINSSFGGLVVARVRTAAHTAHTRAQHDTRTTAHAHANVA